MPFKDLVRPLGKELAGAVTAAKKQTTNLNQVGGLSNDHLVGVEGLEPPTLSV